MLTFPILALALIAAAPEPEAPAGIPASSADCCAYAEDFSDMRADDCLGEEEGACAVRWCEGKRVNSLNGCQAPGALSVEAKSDPEGPIVWIVLPEDATAVTIEFDYVQPPKTPGVPDLAEGMLELRRFAAAEYDCDQGSFDPILILNKTSETVPKTCTRVTHPVELKDDDAAIAFRFRKKASGTTTTPGLLIDNLKITVK